jgi:hypothetical protein
MRSGRKVLCWKRGEGQVDAIERRFSHVKDPQDEGQIGVHALQMRRKTENADPRHPLLRSERHLTHGSYQVQLLSLFCSDRSLSWACASSQAWHRRRQVMVNFSRYLLVQTVDD